MFKINLYLKLIEINNNNRRMMQQHTTKKTYYFEIVDCRYSGRSVHWSEKEESDAAFSVELELPEKGVHFYIINEFSGWDIEQKIWFENYKDAKRAMMKLYSQINNCLPFKVTGMSSSYKEDGYYPDIPEEIQKMNKIDFEPLNDEEYYFVVIVDKEDGIVDDLLIQPCG